MYGLPNTVKPTYLNVCRLTSLQHTHWRPDTVHFIGGALDLEGNTTGAGVGDLQGKGAWLFAQLLAGENNLLGWLELQIKVWHRRRFT